MNIDPPCEEELAQTRHYLELTRRQRDAIRRELKSCQQNSTHVENQREEHHRKRQLYQDEEQARRAAAERSRREAEEERAKRRLQRDEEQARREAAERSRREAAEERAKRRMQREAAERSRRDKEEADTFGNNVPANPSVQELRKNLYIKNSGIIDDTVVQQLVGRENDIRTNPTIPESEIIAFIDAYREISSTYLQSDNTPPERYIAFLRDATNSTKYGDYARLALEVVEQQYLSMQTRAQADALELEKCSELMCKYGIYGKKDVQKVRKIGESDNPDRGTVVSCFKNKKYCDEKRAFMHSGNFSQILTAKKDLDDFSAEDLQVLAKHYHVPENITKNDICWLIAIIIHHGATSYLE